MSDEDTNNPSIPTGTGNPISQESSLSNWAGDYVTDMLGRGQALTNMPYEGYQGDLTAGPTENQTNAFAGIAGLTLPTDGYSSDVAMFDQAAADQYMNPYISSVLQPQLAEMQRQNQIQQVSDNAAFTKAGAYGGGRQAIMNAERNDNMARLQNEATQQGYSNAYKSAFDMFTSDQNRLEDSAQFGANFGLKSLGAQQELYNQQLRAGEVERGITNEGLAADQAQFKEERDYPYKQIQYGMGLLNGMPLAAQNYGYQQPSTLGQYVNAGTDVSYLLDLLFGTQQTPTNNNNNGNDGDDNNGNQEQPVVGPTGTVA